MCLAIIRVEAGQPLLQHAREESPDCIERGVEGNLRRKLLLATAGAFVRKQQGTEDELTSSESNRNEFFPTTERHGEK